MAANGLKLRDDKEIWIRISGLQGTLKDIYLKYVSILCVNFPALSSTQVIFNTPWSLTPWLSMYYTDPSRSSLLLLPRQSYIIEADINTYVMCNWLVQVELVSFISIVPAPIAHAPRWSAGFIPAKTLKAEVQSGSRLLMRSTIRVSCLGWFRWLNLRNDLQ